jgi:hypothetical protein
MKKVVSGGAYIALNPLCTQVPHGWFYKYTTSDGMLRNVRVGMGRKLTFLSLVGTLNHPTYSNR